MKKYTHITFNGAGQIVAFVMPPDKPEPYHHVEGQIPYIALLEDYEHKVKAAIKDGVVFKKCEIFTRTENVYLVNDVPMLIEKGKHYPVPDGYEVKIEKVYEKGVSTRPSVIGKYAILVPKQEYEFYCGDETDGDIRCKKQCKDCTGVKEKPKQ